MLFQSFGLRDFARIDGWFLPGNSNTIRTLAKDYKFGFTESGTIIFTDINLVREDIGIVKWTPKACSRLLLFALSMMLVSWMQVSGMEQTSFLFQQASKVLTISLK